MLVIREKQINSVVKERQTQFKKKVNTYIQKEHRNLIDKMSQTEIDVQIHSGIKKALSYDISSETGIVSFILLTFIAGLDFDINPHYGWAQKILTNDHYSENEKIEKLIHSI
jgi:hypothetical protein